jgi:hypothetical protein
MRCGGVEVSPPLSVDVSVPSGRTAQKTVLGRALSGSKICCVVGISSFQRL